MFRFVRYTASVREFSAELLYISYTYTVPENDPGGDASPPPPPSVCFFNKISGFQRDLVDELR